MVYIVPQPKKMEVTQEKFSLRYNTRIILDQKWGVETYEYAKLLAKTIQEETAIVAKILKGNKNTANNIVLAVSETELPTEGYTLDVCADGVRVAASATVGLLYGIQSLRQLIAGQGAVLEGLHVEDYPSLPNRGFYHDATRGRIRKIEEYKKMADTLSYFKMNQLQLYVEHTYLFDDFSEVWRDDTPITADEIMELDAYCRKLHIDLVPSIATFGHLYKVLKTKSYEDLCEMEGMTEDGFSFDQRMQHHMLDASNPESYPFVEKMLDEFLPMFSSEYVNICADETFDIGKGRSKALADEIGTNRMYVDFVKKVAEYVVNRGKIPMFWGDIIRDFAEFGKELPENIICLNWGYCDNEWEGHTVKMKEVGMKQYLCPGVHGWRHMINLISMGYANVSLLTYYALKYDAEGVLNTDWGDYGHLQDVSFSMPGMIYGAACAWSGKTSDELPKEWLSKKTISGPELQKKLEEIGVYPWTEAELNEAISRVYYQDPTGQLLKNMKELSELEDLRWEEFVQYKEWTDQKEKDMDAVYKEFRPRKPVAVNEMIDKAVAKLYADSKYVNAEGKQLVRKLDLFAQGQKLMHTTMELVGVVKYDEVKPEKAVLKKMCYDLAAELETWMYEYKEVWREDSKESELYRIEEVFYWYSDLLRRFI